MLLSQEISWMSFLVICLSYLSMPALSLFVDWKNTRRESHELAVTNLEESQILPRQSSSLPFTGDNFVRLGFHSSIVVGNTLYIDGGEVNWKVNGAVVPQAPMNDTLTIDLSQSWSPSSVEINAIQKGSTIPVYNYEALWAAADNQSFYMWGGAVSRSLGNADGRNKPNNLFQFKDGNWSQVALNSSSIFATLNRPAAGMSAYGNGTGYYLGGYNSEVDPASNGPFSPNTGLMIYNMADNTWKNVTSNYDSDGTAFFGGMEYAPIFGSQGLLVAFGGEESNLNGWQDNGQLFQPFQTVAVYDPSGPGQWYFQETTGDVPPQSDMFCTVGIQSDIGTYEIFVYGGHNDSYINGHDIPEQSLQSQQIGFNHTYVLSLPGFNWFKVNDTSAKPRTGHTCELAGNRQMISIGGLDPTSNPTVNFSDADTNPQGLGVFDMVQLKWTNEYDANAAPYTSADPIKAWYSNPNSNSSVKWSSDQVKALFLRTSTTASPGTTSSPSSTPALSSSSYTQSGAIAGGVVGGILGLALIAGAIWFFVRHRKQQRPMLSEFPANEVKRYPAAYDSPYLPDKTPAGYSSGGRGYVMSEIGGQSITQELDSTPAKQELESPQSTYSPQSPPRWRPQDLDSAI